MRRNEEDSGINEGNMERERNKNIEECKKRTNIMWKRYSKIKRES